MLIQNMCLNFHLNTSRITSTQQVFLFKKVIKIGKFIYSACFIIVTILSITARSGWAAALVHDDFNGTQLASIWRLHSGYASVQDGWVTLSGSTPGTRGGYIVTGEGSKWSDYHLSTRVIMNTKDIDDWYLAPVKVRVKTIRGNNRGTYYEIEMASSFWRDRASVALVKCVDDVISFPKIVHPAPGVIHDYDNKLDIEAIGPRIKVWVNDQLVLDHTDTDPLLTGGVSLGALWESTSRYDYVYTEESSSPLRATAVASTAIRLSWVDSSISEKGFRVQRKEGACSSRNPWVTLADKGANTTSLATFLDSPLLAATPYSYQVSTFYGGSSFSTYSECASATTGAAGTPHIPTSLSAVSKSNSRVDLTWNDVSELETDFKIYRQAGSGSLTLLDTVGANSQHYSDMSATGNIATIGYRYDVRACKGAGCSLPNTPAVVPFRPTALAATVAATVHLSWKDNSSDESGFEVWRKNGTCTAENPWVVVNKVAANTKAFNDSSAVPSTEYAYKVRAYSASGVMPQTFGYSLFTGCASSVAP